MASKRKKRKLIVILFQKYWLLVLWISLNCYAFFHTYSQYKGKSEYYYLRMILGTGLCISRGSATVLNINCCLILFPICRAVNSLVCKVINDLCNKNFLLFWLQNTKKFHIAIGITITISSVVHTLAHIQNAVNFSKNYDESHKSINWAAFKYENPVIMVMKSLTGATGVLMLVIIIVLAISSSSIIRKNNYNIFWYTHNICYLFVLSFLIHPLSGILKEQTNVTIHKPGCISGNTTKIYEKCEEAEFIPIQSQGWLWIILPIIIYLLDRLFRLIRRNNGMVCVVNAKRLHDGIVLTITLPHPGFKAKPGEFVILNCPIFSRLEWHPFTIIKSPTSSQPFFQILVHARGDWSKKLYAQEFDCDTISYKWPPHKPIRLYIDGPYSSPMEEIIKNRVVIGIAAGVGITPFMSSIKLNDTKIPEKIHITWIVRDVLQVEWCSYLLLAYHNKCWKNNAPDKFSFRIYITNVNQKISIKNIENEILKNRLHPGRPDWNKLFLQWNNLHPSQKRHVFTCGPKSLTNQIKKLCDTFKNFHFVRESFA